MRSNFGVTLTLNLKRNNFHGRYSVQNIFCEIILCLGDTEMWLFTSHLVEEALNDTFKNGLCSFLKSIKIFCRLICNGNTQ